MNKVLIGSILTFGLLLLESPAAAADEERGKQYRPHAYSPVRDYRHNYRHDYRRDSRRHDYYSRNTHRGERYDKRHHRAKRMPHWLKRDRSFRRWLDHTHLDTNRYVTWHQLFDVYLREHSYSRYRRH